MMKKKTLWLAPLLGLLAMPAFADEYGGSYQRAIHRYERQHDRFEQRLERQRDRIRVGVRSGELTRAEANRLRKQIRRIATLKRELQRDGYLDRHERRKLQLSLDRTSERIARLTRNDRYPHHRNSYRGWHDHDA